MADLQFSSAISKKNISRLFYVGIILSSILACAKTENDNENSSNHTHLASTANLVNISPVGDVVGKIVVGYQGWFSCFGDGSPVNNWRHWRNNTPPSPGNQSFELWPNVNEFAQTFQTGYANLGNGQPSKLYSSYQNNVVDKHLQWMQQYGIDCAAVQRFGSELGDAAMKATRDGIAVKVKNAAQTFGRKFYMMYDISGWANFQAEIKSDWINTITGSLNLTSSGAYARQNGKPVVCIWGVGVSGRPGNATSWTEVIDWFKSKGCYVIVGTKRDWRTDSSNLSAVISADMISPWTVGSYKTDADIDNYANIMSNDKILCDQNGKDYQPVVFPGFAWSNWKTAPQNEIPRRHGDFLWRQFYQIRSKSIPNAYVAMFDEYDEATAIAKSAENVSQIPSNQYFLTLDADGVACSSDFYLRLTGDGAKMVKGQIAISATHPTAH